MRVRICYNCVMVAKKSKNQTAQSVSEIRKALRQQLPHLAATYQVSYLGVFGSYVQGAVHSESDLDILVDFSRTPTLFQFVRLKNELTELLGIPVDLVMKSALKPKIGEHILAEVVPV